ncbi:MAG: uroporphyrinogen-III C-methyltransferase, partial [Sulfuricurvum sp.]|nr:uroporphyrinogen-III C-methyltransferase [Sulfuricurvum sp.]
MYGKVYLTGAGPGDPDLLTVKALRLIRQADVIVYDRLINGEILREAKKESILVYVGKENNHHTLPQEEINALLVAYAHTHETIVRLKGGDPLVFGRGGEEALYLSKNGITFEFVPGISSAIAVPAYA